MSWDDDYYADEFGERRPARRRRAGGRSSVASAGYAGLVVGVIALAVGAVFAVNVARPRGEARRIRGARRDGPSVALPPVVDAAEQGEPVEGGSEPAEQADDAETAPDRRISDSVVSPMPLVDPEWTSRIAAATGFPSAPWRPTPLAHVAIAEEEPECGIDWTTIAAIGAIESDHGSHGGTLLDAERRTPSRPIIGRALDGNGVAKIDGHRRRRPRRRRHVGPRGRADAVHPLDLGQVGQRRERRRCRRPEPDRRRRTGHRTVPVRLGPDDQPRRVAGGGVYSYNHDNDYVDKVARVANGFAASAG